MVNNLTPILLTEQCTIIQFIHSYDNDLNGLFYTLDDHKKLTSYTNRHIHAGLIAKRTIKENFDNIIQFIEDNDDDIIIIENWFDLIYMTNQFKYSNINENRILIDSIKLKLEELHQTLLINHQTLILTINSEIYLQSFKPLLDNYSNFGKRIANLYTRKDF